MNIYQQQIIDHYHNPQNMERPEDYTHVLKLQNLSCGDEIEVFLTVKDEKITNINYLAEGCAISIASASLLSEELVGKSISEVTELDVNSVYEILGITLTPSRSKCAHLALEAIQKAYSPTSN